jgi:hypothetical protein
MLSDDFWDGLNDGTDEDATMEMLETAYNNSYKIATKKCTFEELIELADDMEVKFTVVMHDIDLGPNDDDIENMITWYEQYEDYEKCAELQKLLSK